MISEKVIRKNYNINNPTISDRKNITQTEWKRAEQVDPENDFKYMNPDTVRDTKSRQVYYYSNPPKMSQAFNKQVWQQYVAKSLLTYFQKHLT